MPDLTPASTPDYVLQPLSPAAGDIAVTPFELLEPGPFIAGRSSESDWSVPDQAVSRRHAQFTHHGGDWYISDLGSRHGTRVNGKTLVKGERHPLAAGDLIEFGVWSCRCRAPGAKNFPTTTFDDKPRGGSKVAQVEAAQLDGLAQRRLDALLTVSREFNQAADFAGLATAAVRAIEAATGCSRVVVVEQVAISEFKAVASSSEDVPRLSRTLIEAAHGGQLVELRDSGAMEQAMSIIDLGIRSAICAPIMVGNSPEAFVYLDTRGSERALSEDAAAFCQSVAQQAGLALERLNNARLAARAAQLEQDLSAARNAQELLMPALTGTLGPVRYGYESHAGRVVAGDLFDIFQLTPTRIAVFLGDVSGKGVGAAVLMASAQSQLKTRLTSGLPLHEAVTLVNRELHARTATSKFVTLLAAIIDLEANQVELVDAGHAHGALVPPGGPAQSFECEPGFPLGMVDDHAYELATRDFAPGSTLVLYSDGVVEQQSPAGKEFGLTAAHGLIQPGDEPAAIAAALVAGVRGHAEGDLDDDLTVAAIRLG